ncbi:MAG TPA: hypothetical protein DEO64_09345 [Alcaligenes faecalis]|nr:hypothetical protein [Alcaligenes faecalis]
MTSLIQLKPLNTIAPEGQASRLLGLVKEIDKAAKEANVKVAEIESRGFFKNLVTSSRDDLVSTARSQSRINDLLVRLNQEVVALNTLGYVYLASVFAEFERQINEGVRDSDGKIHVLSESGKRVASAAKEMFSAILDSSRSTQEKIDATAEAADALRAEVDRLTEETVAHSELINGLQVGNSTLQENSEHLGVLAAQQHVSIEQLTSRVEADRIRALESDSRIAQTFQRLESEFERVAASTVELQDRTHSLQEATPSAQATSEEHRVLTAGHSEAILRTTAQLEFLVKSYRGLEKDVPTLAAQMAKMTASQANEKSQLLRAVWALGASVAVLTALCSVLALKTWQIL